jgi:MFS family permease
VRERRDRHGDCEEEGDARDDERAELRVCAATQTVPDRDRERAEQCARERPKQDRDQLLGSARGRPVDAHGGDHARFRSARARVRRALIGGCALAVATGWNISNTGAIATQLSHRYGIGLATVGLFTTALFTTHLLAQIPGGRASDRFGARRAGLLALVVIAVFAGASMAAPDAWLAIVTRALAGFGTGVSFVAGSAYVRAVGGSPAAQGLFGGAGLAGGGVALALVPQVERFLGWRAPYATAVAVALLGLILLAAAPAEPRRQPATPTRSTGVLLDRQLYRLALLYSASLGLSVTAGNWVVTLLDRHGGLSKGSAGAIGSLTLVLGIVTRPLGGWILREHPQRARLAVGASLAGGAAGTLLLAVAQPPVVAALGAALVGIAAGIPFSPSFTGAALLRPDAPAAAVGLVNGAAAGVILAGTPLLGLSFGLPGDGRAGFCVVAALWLATLLVLPSARELGATATQRSRSG